MRVIKKNTVTGNVEYVTSIVLLEFRANTGDSMRIENAAINKAEVVQANDQRLIQREKTTIRKTTTIRMY